MVRKVARVKTSASSSSKLLGGFVVLIVALGALLAFGFISPQVASGAGDEGALLSGSNNSSQTYDAGFVGSSDIVVTPANPTPRSTMTITANVHNFGSTKLNIVGVEYGLKINGTWYQWYLFGDVYNIPAGGNVSISKSYITAYEGLTELKVRVNGTLVNGSGYLVADSNTSNDQASKLVSLNVPNNPPTASISGPSSCIVNQSCGLFIGSGSDTDGYITGYKWWCLSMGPPAMRNCNPSSSTSRNFSFAHAYVETVTLILNATDDDGAMGTTTKLVNITVAQPFTDVSVVGMATDNIKISPASPFVNSNFSVNITINNIGTANVTKFSYNVELDGAILLSSTMTNLAPGASKTLNMMTSLNTAGVHTIKVKITNVTPAEPANKLGNNEATKSFTVLAAQPNVTYDAGLSSGDITFSPATPIIGYSFKINAILHNYGTKTVTARSAYRLKVNGTWGNWASFGSTSIAAGANKTRTFNCGITPNGLEEVAVNITGLYNTSGRSVNDSNLTNNYASHPITVVLPTYDAGISAGDIIVPANLTAGQYFTLRAKLHNNGNVVISAYAMYRLKVNNSWSSWKSQKLASSIQVNNYKSVTFGSVLATRGLQEIAVNITKVTYSGHIVTELNYSNNYASRTVTVS